MAEDDEEPSPELRPWQGSLRSTSLAADAVRAAAERAGAVETAPIEPPEPPAPVEEITAAAEAGVVNIDVRRLAWIVGGIVAMLTIATHVPLWRTELGIRVEYYGSSLVFFALVTAGVVCLESLRYLPVRQLLGGIGAAFVIGMVGNVFDVPVITDIAKLAFATLAGLGIVRAIERPWWLLPVCIFVPVSDAWSVYSSRGVTNQIVEQSSGDARWVNWPTLVTPSLGVSYGDSARIGIVDIFFLALLLGAACRWQLRVREVAIAMTLSFVASTVLAQELPDGGVPALPLLCLAFLLVAGKALVADLRAELAGAK